ncbi:lysoplasmalogenase [Polyangium sp. 6x1]|uniref:lysoplasmalogenase n=1 Tax=Polyangium sp. 6x1 TaxID=3042689 RepID=UPI0024823ED6|nr:lysoplasmalogenase [Polyangium sp. 6x1]MDI1450932.1 lysoplasmalogenase [Polyangium sp. 6x1]
MDLASSRRREAIFFGAYLASAAASCVLITLAPGSIAYRLLKVTPLFLLCAARLRERQGRLAKFVGLGLFASLVADAVIDNVFVAGLGVFLVAHLFYLIGMGLPGRTAGAWLTMLPALAFGGLMWKILVGSGRAPEALHAPITAYAIVISSMLGRALGRALVEPKDHASRIFCAGAIFFVISDSLIGVNRWVFPLPLGPVWILSTYWLGQFLIFRGSTPGCSTA